MKHTKLFSRKTTILKMCPPPPQKKQNSKQHKAKGNTPHKDFQSDNHQNIVKYIRAYFHKKPNGFQEMDQKTDQKIPQNSPRGEELL